MRAHITWATLRIGCEILFVVSSYAVIILFGGLWLMVRLRLSCGVRVLDSR